MVHFKSICEPDFNYDVEALGAAIDNSRRETLKWDDLCAYSTCLVQLSAEAERLITKIWGKQPTRKYLVKHEPIVRALLHEYYTTDLTEQKLLSKCRFHLIDGYFT
jgi:hypothetical protein